MAVYFVIAAKKRKDKEQNSKSGPPKFAYVPTTVSSALYPAPIQLDLASVDQNKEILSQYQSGAVTIYDGRTVPVHWSASQLLQEHERRHSPCGQTEPSDHFTAPSNDSAFISGSYHLNSGSAIYDIVIHLISRTSTTSYRPITGRTRSTTKARPQWIRTVATITPRSRQRRPTTTTRNPVRRRGVDLDIRSPFLNIIFKNTRQ
jgi:hypothetical protein